ncbi:MAG: DNA polymerase III subunit gamma/tau, partial [Acidimicrobiia bacterium]|nr:DNA polymerase III subunit gamma/tau [Acidimicrobiia bacterium]
MAYQSLYRRYRPQRFGEIRGQRHVVSALQNAVVKGEVGHAYLFHGPRGTGKTTSARVLAKALNCENLSSDGEPCGECESCVAVEQGRSFDLHELDAASNNKVEDMRDLLAKVNLGTPGRAKVYILDEVHMLTSQAENALLKTLEEPPDHVTWVLATTEPHKVVETIRSRCQVFQLTLLGAEEMAEHVRWVINDAGLDVSDDAVEYVVAAGGGSVRDTLSALDRVVAAGG